MDNFLKTALLVAFIFTIPIINSKEAIDFKNISISANKVILDEKKNELTFQGKIQIKFGDLTIDGNDALLSYKEEILTVNGSPALILSSSKRINGKASKFIIHPNQSMLMVGNAQLINGEHAISSEEITYLINPND